MKLYYHPISPYSHKALIAFYEKDVSFEPAIVNLGDPEGRAAYEKIYPLCKIPLLVLKDGYMVPESTIIVEYLEGHFDQGTRLIPKGMDDARRVRFMDRVVDLYVNEPMLKVFFDQIKLREILPADLERARKVLAMSYSMLDRGLEKTTWIAGNDFSMADCGLIPCLYNLQNLFPFSSYTHLSRYWKQAQERASYQRVREEQEPALKAMMAAKQ